VLAMACNNSLHVLHEVVDTDQPVVIVNRLSGGFLWNSGDLQLGWAEYDLKAENGTVNPTSSYLWRICSERVNGETVYRIRTNAGADPENQTQYCWTVNATVAPWKSGILWKAWADSGNWADAQRWNIISTCEGGIAFVPHYARIYVLGLLNRDLAAGGCVRPVHVFYNGYIALGCTWEIVHEREVDLVEASRSDNRVVGAS
jgi:hypothetical protein